MRLDYCYRTAPVSLVVALAAAAPAMAQDATATPASGGNEIIVTAQHRNQSVQDVPIAIAALSGDALAREGVKQAVDLARVTPGLSSTNATSGGTPIFAIRGIGLDDFNPNNLSGVATYVDDVAISSSAMLSGQMFDVDRVEVLKGPQGTLYGRNATGGAINFQSRMPTENTEGYLNLGYGRWNKINVDGAVGGKLAEGLTARVAGTYERAFDGWQTDQDTGRQYGKPNRLALRGLLRYEVTPDLTAVLNLHYSQDHSISPSPQSDGNEALVGGTSAGHLDTDTSDAGNVRVGSLRPHRHDTGYGAGLTLTWDAGAATVTSVTGWDRYKYRSVDNNDGVAGPTYDFFQRDDFNQFYQEVRAASKEGLFGGLIDWGVGASYSHDRVHGLDSADQSTPYIGIAEDPMDFTTSGLSVSANDYIQTRDSIGLYGNAETHLTDKLSFLAGLRFSHDRIAFDGASTEEGSVDGGVLFNGVGSVITAIDEVHKTSNLSYRIGLTYKPDRAVMFYATVSSAYKSGAYYASPALDAAAWGYVQPERITDFEGGFKARLFNNVLTLNGGIYYYQYRNRQSQLLFVSPSSGFPVASLGTIPKSRVFGQELEAVLRPVQGLELAWSGNHLDTKIQETATDVRGATLYAEIPVGSSLPQAPKWSWVARAHYETPVTPDWRASFQLDYSYTGKQAAVLGDPNAIYGPWKDLGARIELAQDGDSGISVGVWARNLTDADAKTYAFTSFYGGAEFYRQLPRSYGVTAGYKF